MTPEKEFETLLSAYERNNATGSLKAANGTLIKMLRLVWTEVCALRAAQGAGASPEAAATALDMLNADLDQALVQDLDQTLDQVFGTQTEAETTDVDVTEEENVMANAIRATIPVIAVGDPPFKRGRGRPRKNP